MATLLVIYENVAFWAKNILGLLIGISIPLSVLFLIGIIYSVERLKQVRRKEKEIYDLPVVPAYVPAPAGDANMAARWHKVKDHIGSANPNDWRQAIMEADIILDDLLNKMGYRGESIGEKLKRVEPGDFVTLDNAWEAHKIRNQVAHGGSDFELTEREARKAIDNYRRVFEEFYYI